MHEEKRGHTPDNLIWKGKDHKSTTVCLYANERDHIIERHDVPMGKNFTAIYDSVSSPDLVFESGEYDNREVFYKLSPEASYFPRLMTKTIVEYDAKRTKGFIVTAMPAKEVGGNIGVRTYPEEEL